MVNITFTLPDTAVAALQLSPPALVAEIRLAAAIKLYEIQRLSAGAAALLAGIPVPLFLTRLADYSLPTFQQSEAELRRELANA